MKIGDRRRKAGRPPCDVSDFVHAHVTAGLERGATLTEATRTGVVIYDRGDGKILRQMKGKDLQAKYRDGERDRISPWLRPTVGYTHAWPVFMGRQLPVAYGAAALSEREAGRPPKKARVKI